MEWNGDINDGGASGNLYSLQSDISSPPESSPIITLTSAYLERLAYALPGFERSLEKVLKQIENRRENGRKASDESRRIYLREDGLGEAPKQLNVRRELARKSLFAHVPPEVYLVCCGYIPR